jgi:hypothetical protein
MSEWEVDVTRSHLHGVSVERTRNMWVKFRGAERIIVLVLDRERVPGSNWGLGDELEISQRKGKCSG